MSIREHDQINETVGTSEATLFSVLNQMPVATLVASEDGQVRFMSRECLCMFGHTSDGSSDLVVEDFVPDVRRAVHVEYRKAYCAAPSPRMMNVDRVVTGLRKDGTEFAAEVGLGAVATHEGMRFIATIGDISRRKSLEESLLKSNAELKDRNTSLDEFAYMASHDLQEPIRKLVSFSEMLTADLGSDLPENAAMDLRFIVDAAYRMRQLVQDMLRLSQTGKEAMRIERVDLNASVAEVLDDLQERVNGCNAEIEVPRLPHVIADAFLMRQLFLNLISNALKFSRKDVRPSIQVTVEECEGETVFGVRDNGIGIAAEFHDRIFGAFRRVHSRSEYSGSGVGLSICRKAVERHGGKIWVESEAGKGSHFRFTLGSIPGKSEC